MKEIFYIGSAKEEMVKRQLNEDGSLWTGYCEDGEWAVLVDRVAIETYHQLLFKILLKNFSKLTRVLKDKGKKRLAPIIKIDEDELFKKIIYNLNQAVMHELSIHWAGGLSHYFLITSLFFSPPLEREKVISLLKQYGLRGAIYLNSELKVDRLLFLRKEVETRQEKIIKLLYRLKSQVQKITHSRKEYPIIFKLDDIEIKD